MLSNLETLKNTKHEAVIRRYKKDHPKSADDAEKLFEDLMLFFWASKKHELLKKQNPNDEALDFVFIMDEEMKNIDHMWHVYLLYTKDYMDFCEEHFGEYLHHLPDVVPNQDIKPMNFAINLERFLIFVQEHLGDETVERWFRQSLATQTAE